MKLPDKFILQFIVFANLFFASKIAFARGSFGLALDVDYANSVTLGNEVEAKNLGAGSEFNFIWQGAPSPSWWGLGTGIILKSNGTAEIVKESKPSEFQNLSISPQMLFVQAVWGWNSLGFFVRAMAGNARARVVQNRVGFDYNLSKGFGFGFGAQTVFGLFGNFNGTAKLIYNAVQFRDQKLTSVDSNQTPHTGPWKYQGAQVGFGVDWVLF